MQVDSVNNCEFYSETHNMPLKYLAFSTRETKPLKLSYWMLKESILCHTRRDVRTTKNKIKSSQLSILVEGRIEVKDTQLPVVMNVCLHSNLTGE